MSLSSFISLLLRGLPRSWRRPSCSPYFRPRSDDHFGEDDIELTIRLLTTASFRGPIVERAVIGVNGASEPLVWIEVGSTLREGEPLHARVNMGHPVLASAVGEHQATLVPHWAHSEVTEAWEAIAIPEDGAEGEGRGYGGGAGAGLGDGSGFADGRSLPVFALARGRPSALPAPGEPLRVIPFGDDAPEKDAATQQVRTFLEMVVLGTTSQLASFLRDAQYIGPLRTIPPRGFLYERVGRIASWADGLAAWDLLLADRLTLVERTNAWLRRLGADCQVVVQQLFDGSADAEELSEGYVDKTIRRLLLETGTGSFVLPSEVGAGISQLIPVIVAAIEGRGGLTLVEQPEIHVHPAVQVGLGDLLLDAARREQSVRRLILVETHSEHLLLRVMRRLRETAEGAMPDGMRPVRPGDVSIVLVEKEEGCSIMRQMPLNERGELVKAWPGGFFEEGLREVM